MDGQVLGAFVFMGLVALSFILVRKYGSDKHE